MCPGVSWFTNSSLLSEKCLVQAKKLEIDLFMCVRMCVCILFSFRLIATFLRDFVYPQQKWFIYFLRKTTKKECWRKERCDNPRKCRLLKLILSFRSDRTFSLQYLISKPYLTITSNPVQTVFLTWCKLISRARVQTVEGNHTTNKIHHKLFTLNCI
jgi:hypothetical protein